MTRFPLSRTLFGLSSVLLCGAVVAQDPNSTPAPSDSGFLTGLRGFEHFHEPLGQPIYFETPFNDTGVRALFLYHTFGDNAFVQGGHVAVYAAQVRVALSERWQFIATKDGYSDISTGLLGNDAGWNDYAGGLKYVLVADRKQDLVVSTGIRYMTETGSRLYGFLNGNTDEWSPFVSFGKGYDNLHLLGNATLRLPSDSKKGNIVGDWGVHLDYSVNPQDRAVFAPLVEIHGIHYLDDADPSGPTAGLPFGGIDYTNLGSSPNHHFVSWAGIGARVEIDHKLEFGACYEFALTNPDDDLMKDRVTVDFILRW